MELEQLKQAAVMRAEGASYRAIGQAIGVPFRTVHGNLQKDEANQLIKDAQTNIIQRSLSTAVKNQALKIALGHKILKQIGKGEQTSEHTKTLLDIADKAEARVLDATGITGAHTSVQISNVLNLGSLELSPAIEHMLIRHLQDSAKVEDNIIEGEIIDANLGTK